MTTRLTGSVKIPHIGWNTVETPRSSRLFESVGSGGAFYFVHSYQLVPDDPEAVIGVTEYGARFCSAVAAGSVFGVQFHPEKSSAAGLALLAAFGRIVGGR